MNLINALLTHAWLAFSLKHDGAGLPSKLPAACLLAVMYVCLTLANKYLAGGIDFTTIAGLFFVTQFYLFGLRSHLVGLILLISIVYNALALSLITLAGFSPDDLALLKVMEGLMIFAGIINIIKTTLRVSDSRD
ncbi:MAG TPA: hypothetical protein PLR90_03520 [Methylophilus sp.]|nr:hypothetical protein [Methylophilus sp.]HQQ32965.1 hypothetical protein [Methylophilus sp.]